MICMPTGVYKRTKETIELNFVLNKGFVES